MFYIAYAWKFSYLIAEFVLYVIVPKDVFTLTDLSIFNFREGRDWHTAPTLLQHREMESRQVIYERGYYSTLSMYVLLP